MGRQQNDKSKQTTLIARNIRKLWMSNVNAVCHVKHISGSEHELFLYETII